MALFEMWYTERMVVSGPRFLYLHGFASGPSSAKGLATEKHYKERGIAVERLNLRVPSFTHLRVSAMLSTVQNAIGGPSERVVVFGSSLGGYVASRVAEIDARVCSLVLLAPAFRLFERWKERLGDDKYKEWKERGFLEVDDYAEKRKARVDFGFVEDAEALEARAGVWPDVRVPTLIVHGTHDETVDCQVSRTFAEGKRHVRLVEVDDGHDLNASLPLILREADRHLASFLG